MRSSPIALAGAVVLFASCSAINRPSSAPAAGLDGAGSAPLAAAPAAPEDLRPSSTRLTKRPLGTTTAPNGFFEYLPPGYGDGENRPLLVFLHGFGENGDGSSADLDKLRVTAIPRLLAEDRWPGARPFVVLAPQHAGGRCPSAGDVNAFLGWARSAYRIDPRRIYLTGLSCGSIAAWRYLGAFGGGELAGALLLAGDPGDPDDDESAFGRRGCGLRDVSIWAIHGGTDAAVHPFYERVTMERLAACPAPPGRDLVWTEKPGEGHDVWTFFYDGSQVAQDPYEWLLAHRRP